MKPERVVLMTTPQFKRYLADEARRERISVAELVRTRCVRRTTSNDDAALAALTVELRHAVSAAKRSLRSGVAQAEAVLERLRATRRVR